MLIYWREGEERGRFSKDQRKFCLSVFPLCPMWTPKAPKAFSSVTAWAIPMSLAEEQMRRGPAGHLSLRGRTGEWNWRGSLLQHSRGDSTMRAQSGLCSTKEATSNRNLIPFLSEDTGDDLSCPQLRNKQSFDFAPIWRFLTELITITCSNLHQSSTTSPRCHILLWVVFIWR